ncbi:MULTISPECIES: hypothetical protein [unclassified Anaerobiospirillum]|uniref:hypothetical protein n=1 Tax=unclassified Anaerobiospirillum TaxID=2647410 RepID=UPI001FF4B920|nr:MULTISPECIES: hypothetical protein [unclassified Anaerobiospirillum]MCK0533944.1 hypothetical protein [Anaerobiospirillum sp. NML120511]MCK0539147.1 hypothetical protein [Anaerobiospirillum sp. NML02-A-032]
MVLLNNGCQERCIKHQDKISRQILLQPLQKTNAIVIAKAWSNAIVIASISTTSMA